MNELIPLFKQFGPWLGVLVVITYFLIWHLWPHWQARDLANQQAKIDHDKQEQEFRQAQIKRIQEREDSIQKEFAGLIQENIAQSRTMTSSFDAVAELIREDYREKRRR